MIKPITPGLLRLRDLSLMLVFSLGILMGTASAVVADGWSGQVTPYLWATGVGGDITPFRGGPTVSIDDSFSEIVNDLEGAFFLSGFARHDRLVVLGDFSYASLSKKGRLPNGVPAEGEIRQTSLTLEAGYRLVDVERIRFDVLVGARAWWLHSAVKIPVAGVNYSKSFNFIDPIVAARANVRLLPQWSAIFYGDVGGYGVGSKMTSQVLATLNYQVNQHLYASAGFRQLTVDYKSGGTRADVTMSGPLLGVTWQF
ncbi:hypothetical protein [Pelovirga terrestris]|nr:hypothetical protein [Pelovirga terrestris]